MSTAQKVIKYFAIALGIGIIVTVGVGIYNGIGLLGHNFIDKPDDSFNGETTTAEYTAAISNLRITVDATQLTFKSGDSLKLETDSSYIQSREDGDTLYISEENRGIFDFNPTGHVVIYVPSNLTFSNVYINTGAGTLRSELEKFRANTLELEFGAGRATLSNFEIKTNALIKTGAGEVIIENSMFNNLKLETGLGHTALTASLTGSSKLDIGMGRLDLNLKGSAEDYAIRSEKGIGDISINGSVQDNGATYGSGPNYIDLHGGIGSIVVNFEN